MRIDNLVQSVKILVRVDSLIADVKFRTRLAQVALVGSAVVIALFGLIMLGVAGYQFLDGLWGPIGAALAVAAASFAIALILVISAAYRKPGKELAMALELHTTAVDAVVAEVRRAGNDLSAVNSLLHGRFDSSLFGLIGPLAMLLLKLLKKGSGEQPEA